MYPFYIFFDTLRVKRVCPDYFVPSKALLAKIKHLSSLSASKNRS